MDIEKDGVPADMYNIIDLKGPEANAPVDYFRGLIEINNTYS